MTVTDVVVLDVNGRAAESGEGGADRDPEAQAQAQAARQLRPRSLGVFLRYTRNKSIVARHSLAWILE